jgi:hypothetical protein
MEDGDDVETPEKYYKSLFWVIALLECSIRNNLDNKEFIMFIS